MNLKKKLGFDLRFVKFNHDKLACEVGASEFIG